VTWHCACGALVPLVAETTTKRFGIEGLGILRNGIPDTLVASVARSFQPESLGILDCPTCGRRRVRTERRYIDGAPEYLRLKICNVQTIVPNNPRLGVMLNNNPITIPGVLDLTAYQSVTAYPAPLKYRLKSVLCHSGAVTGGHWAATVIDPLGVKRVEDHRVTPQEATYLTTNPQLGMTVVVLMYARIADRGRLDG
jgi:ubiquitin C-terminal hydrolase